MKTSRINIPQYVGEVSPKLMRGPLPSLDRLRVLKEQGVTQVIDLRKKERPYSGLLEKLLCKCLGINYLSRPVPLKGLLPSIDYFQRMTDEIDANKGKTYIHCLLGRHRTGLAVEMYKRLSNFFKR